MKFKENIDFNQLLMKYNPHQLNITGVKISNCGGFLFPGVSKKMYDLVHRGGAFPWLCRNCIFYSSVTLTLCAFIQGNIGKIKTFSDVTDSDVSVFGRFDLYATD